MSTLVVGLVLLLLVPLSAQGADQFASPEFAQQWNSVESVIPNFWGPLETARNRQVEPYAEGVYNSEPGIRLVQYFDKARMEKTNPNRPVTNGLLTVELKTGDLQLGDFMPNFQQRNPAAIGIAGDQDAPGPTYATLGQLPEKIAAQPGGAVDLGYDVPSTQYVGVPPATDPQLAFVTYQGDPGGRFGQDIPKAFWDFMQRIPGGWLPTMGYPIGEAFGTQVRVNNQSTFVVVQAFERRVLTYTPTNPDAFKVEFGNIGQHYYRWRYERSRPVSPPPRSSTFIGVPFTTVTFAATVTDVTWTNTIGANKASGVFVVVFVAVTNGGTASADDFSVVDARGNRLGPASADVQRAAKQQYNANGFGDTVQPGTKAVFVFNAPVVVLIVPATTTATATATMTATPTLTATPTNTPTATPTMMPTMTPTATSTATVPATSGVTFTAVQGAKPGNVASVAVQTAPDASCSIGYVTPRGTQSQAAGLVQKTASASGQVSWSWLIGGNTTPGTGTVTVTCNGVRASSPITIG